jgi:hypothetical protein
LTLFLPEFDHAVDLIFRELNRSQLALWNIRFNQNMAGRKLSGLNRIGPLGLVHSRLRLATVVCVLAGGTVPYLIRPIDSTRDNNFRFIGEAYVYMIMHSEAVRIQGAMVQEIILVQR